jgi:hypothetical protein
MGCSRAFCVCALAAACHGEPKASPALDLSVAVDLAPLACTDPHPPDGGVCGVPVSGQVVDDSGAPLGALTVSVCADQCFFGTTAGDGRFSVAPDLSIVLANYALELHGRPDRVSYYAPLPPLDGGALVYAAPLPLPLLPSSGPELAASGAQTLRSGDLTLTLAAGTTVAFDVEDYGTPNGHQLRVLWIDRPAALPFVDGAAPPAALYALSPFEAGFSQKVALALANRARLPAGAAVDVQSLGGLVNGPPPAGRFKHAATAHVSADGATITTDPGEGISELTWIAIKGLP